MTIMLISLIIIVATAVLLTRMATSPFNKSQGILDLMDAKIADFKSKTFNSAEEKDKVKDELKIELLKMKDNIKNIGSIKAVLIMREKALSKIVEL